MLEYTNTTFKQMRDDLNNHFQEIVKDNNQLFIMNIDTEKLWELYFIIYYFNFNYFFSYIEAKRIHLN